MARKKKKPDRLTRDVLAAEKAGMSYGQWKAKHPHTPDEDDEPAHEPGPGMRTITCAQCGKEFLVRTLQSNKIYCSEECRIKCNNRRFVKRHRNQPGSIATCPICGTDFMVGKNSQVYCSRKCAALGNRQKENQKRNEAEKEAAENAGT